MKEKLNFFFFVFFLTRNAQIINNAHIWIYSNKVHLLGRKCWYWLLDNQKSNTVKYRHYKNVAFSVSKFITSAAKEEALNIIIHNENGVSISPFISLTNRTVWVSYLLYWLFKYSSYERVNYFSATETWKYILFFKNFK